MDNRSEQQHFTAMMDGFCFRHYDTSLFKECDSPTVGASRWVSSRNEFSTAFAAVIRILDPCHFGSTSFKIGLAEVTGAVVS